MYFIKKNKKKLEKPIFWPLFTVLCYNAISFLILMYIRLI
jgi:hypothetical protein